MEGFFSTKLLEKAKEELLFIFKTTGIYFSLHRIVLFPNFQSISTIFCEFLMLAEEASLSWVIFCLVDFFVE